MKSNGSNSIWRQMPELWDELAHCINVGMSGGLAAIRLSAIAGTDFSRSSVIAAARRAGMRFGGGRQTLRRPRVCKPRHTKTAPTINKRTSEPLIEPPFMDLTFDQLGDGQCKFPKGDYLPYLFCGNPADGSWCPYHNNIVHVTV